MTTPRDGDDIVREVEAAQARIAEEEASIPSGRGAHLRVVNLRGEVLVDDDVNRLAITHCLRYAVWPKSDVPGKNRKAEADIHNISLNDLALIEMTPFSGRLKHEHAE